MQTTENYFNELVNQYINIFKITCFDKEVVLKIYLKRFNSEIANFNDSKLPIIANSAIIEALRLLIEN